MRGNSLFVAVLACIKSKAKSCAQIAAQTGVDLCTVRRVLKSFEGRACYIEGYEKTVALGVKTAMWRFGRQPSAAVVEEQKHFVSRRKVKPRKAHINAVGLALELMAQHPCTTNEITEATGICGDDARRLVRKFRAAGLIRIGAWDRALTARAWVAAYSFGPGPDAARPKPQSLTDLRRKYEAEKTAKRRQIRILAAMNNNLFAEAA